MMHPQFQSRWQQAFTLLEVVLALAILAGALAVLGEIMSAADRSAANAQAETRAQQLASSLMDKILTGVIDATDQSRAPLAVDDTVPWVYSVTITQTSIQGITAIELIVEQDLEEKFNPVTYRLVRWQGPTNSSDTNSSNSESNSGTGGGNA